ncbi:hypothetical protein R3P38DRAFT_3072988 [Favolaschia claudopus]|uniref:Uncharacterized protein n=1 Tax=Favolaschia claudopus TaxID=2862362 RepID=A0AAV9ZZP3_9AGAR
MSQDVPAITSAPFHKKLKAELQIIASEMGLNSNATVPNLRKAIQEHLRTHAELADNPKYLTLFAQRTGAAPSARTSADKANEEALQEPIVPETVTGANRTLIERKIKTDPPAQFSRLSLEDGAAHQRKSVDETLEQDSESGSDSESVASRPATPVRQEQDKKAPAHEQKKAVHAALPEVIRVNFFDMNRPQARPHEVPVLIRDVNIATLAAQTGGVEYVASLKELLPVAFANDSPVKERAGRIYRPNVRRDASPHNVGKVEAILDGASRPLNIPELNAYTLRDEGGSLFCDLYMSTSDGVEHSDETAPVGGNETPADQRLTFTGAGSDIPLAIARDRTVHNPSVGDTLDAFVVFLHAFLKESIPELPDAGHVWPRAKYISTMLLRHLLEVKVMTVLTAWSRPTGGYLVPHGHGEFSGMRFTKDEVLLTINIKSSSSSNDNLLFAPDNLAPWPRAKEWYESGGKTHKDSFDRMTTSKFKKGLKQRLDGLDHPQSSASRNRRRSPSPSAAEGSSRKHRRSVSVSSDDSVDLKRRSKKKGASKKRRGRSITSENLDDNVPLHLGYSY